MVQAATDEAEGAQALFCYLADYVGSAKINAGEWDQYITKDFLSIKGAYKRFKKEFQKKYPRVIDSAWSVWVETKLSKDRIEKYLEQKDDWFVSSIRTAKKLILDIDSASKGVDKQFGYIKAPKSLQVFYKHGDEEVMGLMSKLYKIANDTSAKGAAAGIPKPEYFGNLNKWSPADIYYATKFAIKELEDLHKIAVDANNLKFHTLNTKIGTLIDEGQLLPLSLKKVGLTGDVQLKKVNWMGKKGRAVEEKAIAGTRATGAGREDKGEYNPTKDSAKFEKWYNKTKGIFTDWNSKFPDKYVRDLYVRMKTGKPHGKVGAIQFRHTPAASGRPSQGFKTILKYPGQPMAGQVVGIPLLEKIFLTADKEFATQLSSKFQKGYGKFASAMTLYNTKGGFQTKEYGLISGNDMYNNGPFNNVPKYKRKELKDGKEFKRIYGRTLKDTFNDQVGYLSAVYIMKDFNEFLNKKFKGGSQVKTKSHNCIGAIWEYTSSRTAKSSPFVIAK